MIHSILKERPDLIDSVTLLDQRTSETQYLNCRRMLLTAQTWPKTELDAANVEPIKAIEWFRSLGLCDRDVFLVWLTDRDVCRIGSTYFRDAYDDFWFPSRDDVALFDDKHDWLLLFDHEEIFTLWRHID